MKQTMLALEETDTVPGQSCDLCGLRERSESQGAASHLRAMADLERRAASGGLWQLCRCCQIALSLWDSGIVDGLPSA
jgi:hypothetical protein